MEKPLNWGYNGKTTRWVFLQPKFSVALLAPPPPPPPF